MLKAMDRFHPIPDAPEFAASWAEWLYFNGRTADGRLRFYLTFMVGPTATAGKTARRRAAAARSRRQDDDVLGAGEVIDDAQVLAAAPDLDIAGSRVRLEDSQYRITLALPGASGTLVLDAAAGQSLPPATITGARGWVTGYTAPVLSGTVQRRAAHRRRCDRAARRRRLSRSQLGILERRALAMGPGRARRSVVRLRADLSAAGRRRSRARPGLSRRARRTTVRSASPPRSRSRKRATSAAQPQACHRARTRSGDRSDAGVFGRPAGADADGDDVDRGGHAGGLPADGRRVSRDRERSAAARSISQRAAPPRRFADRGGGERGNGFDKKLRCLRFLVVVYASAALYSATSFAHAFSASGLL